TVAVTWAVRSLVFERAHFRQSRRQVILRCFDLEAGWPYLQPSTTKQPLQLVIHPARNGTVGLQVDVEVWNLSAEPQFVFPIDPMDYNLQFRDATGMVLELYTIPPIDKAMRLKSDLTRLAPGNRLRSTYLLPSFYRTVKNPRG